MTVRQQWIVVGVVVAVLAAAAFAASRFLSDELQQITIGSRAPTFSAATMTQPSAAKTIRDYEGDVVLLNIWATWCLPCREEMPSMQKVHEALADKGLKVVAVSIDQPGMRQAISEFAAEYALTFEILYDSTGAIRQQYRTTGVPETFVIARDGIIRKKWIGAADWNSEGNRRLLESLLAEPGGRRTSDTPSAQPVTTQPR